MAHDNAQSAVHGTTIKGYLVGFILALVLTVIPFVMVMNGGASKQVLSLIICSLAAIQMFVHVVFFLHLDRSSAQRLNVQSGIFTVLLIGVIVLGSFWVMHNLAVNMMQ